MLMSLSLVHTVHRSQGLEEQPAGFCALFRMASISEDTPGRLGPDLTDTACRSEGSLFARRGRMSAMSLLPLRQHDSACLDLEDVGARISHHQLGPSLVPQVPV